MQYKDGKKTYWLLRGATILHLDPPRVEITDIRIRDGLIYQLGKALQPLQDEAVINLEGKWLMPGMVCGHTHLYSALSCGMPMPAIPPINFAQMLEGVWWRLDRALDREGIRISAKVGGVAALRAGVTTIIDHHASPNAIDDSLTIIDKELEELGLRRILCYEVTDRGGHERALAGLKAHENLLSSPLPSQSAGMRGVMIGAHANFTLSDDTLRRCIDLATQAQLGLHIHVAEAIDDEKITGEDPVQRLKRLGGLLPGSLLAHCVHTTHADLRDIEKAGAWVSHQPRSNMNNAVGYAPVEHFGNQTIMGTDGIGADMFTELQTAWFRAQEAKVRWDPARWLRTLAQTAHFASSKLGIQVGRIAPQNAADLVVLDPVPGPPLTKENLASAFIFRLSSMQVRHVMVNGRWRLWERKPNNLNLEELDEEAQQVATDLWKHMEQL